MKCLNVFGIRNIQTGFSMTVSLLYENRYVILYTILHVVGNIMTKVADKSGKTWRERVEREVGGGIGMGNTCKPKAVSFQCMTKFTTNKKINK